MTEYARNLVEQQIGTEQSRAALEKEEANRLLNEVDGAEIIQQAEKLFGKTYLGKTGGVQQAAQDLAQYNVNNNYISTGRSKLLLSPLGFRRELAVLGTLDDSVLAQTAEDLFPEKYDSTSAPAALLKDRAGLINQIAEKKYNIDQNQEQLSINEKTTPIRVGVGSSGKQQGKASEQINTRAPENPHSSPIVQKIKSVETTASIVTETFKLARKNMVLNQLRPNKIKEENILKAFETIPKENYLTDNIQKSCYLLDLVILDS